MAQSEQLAAQRRESGTSRGVPYPLIVVLVAAAFAANAWFFYHQGQRDAANPNSEATPLAVPAAPSESAAPSATASQPAADNTQTASPNPTQPSAANEAAKPAVTNTATGTAAPQPSAKSAKRLVAKTSKPASSVVANASERQAVLVVRPKPAYPVQALRAGEQGTVFVLAQVDVSGRVSDVRIARHSGSPTLDRAAQNEVRRWMFEPALHNGRPVMASVEVPVSYRLEQ